MVTTSLQRGKTPSPYKFSIYDTKLHLMVSLGVFRNIEYPFIAIIPRSTLTRSCSTC